MPEDIPEPAQEGVVEVTYETLGDLVQRFHDHTEAIPVHRVQLERDNMRLRGTVSVESPRVNQLQRGMARMQRELRQIRRFRFYDRMLEDFSGITLSCLLKEQLLEPALNLTVHCCGLEFRVLNGDVRSH
ncbi:hypothetical protein Tco_1070212 [Tanacetum coccineum]|uniref:Uncharacterized protein n=1 Tax=Tanacetum coccineum TaxID=301880 RepID=A0ABQ5HL39_9ASTR